MVKINQLSPWNMTRECFLTRVSMLWPQSSAWKPLPPGPARGPSTHKHGAPTLPSPGFPGALVVGRLQVRGVGGAALRRRGRGGAGGPPSESLACFNQGPMRALTKEPGWNHRLLLCCTGSQRGCEGLRGCGGCSRRHSRPSALFALEIVLSQVTVKGTGSRHDILHCHEQSDRDCEAFAHTPHSCSIHFMTCSWKMMTIHRKHSIQSEQWGV